MTIAGLRSSFYRPPSCCFLREIVQGGGGGQALSGGFQAGSGTLCWDFLFPVPGLAIASRPKMTLKIVRRALGEG